MRSLAAVDMLESSVTKGLVDYLIKKKSDHLDIIALSDSNDGYKKGIHFIMLVAHSNSDIKNKNILNHINNFCSFVLI